MTIYAGAIVILFTYFLKQAAFRCGITVHQSNKNAARGKQQICPAQII